jgi:hypothetical protein
LNSNTNKTNKLLCVINWLVHKSKASYSEAD